MYIQENDQDFIWSLLNCKYIVDGATMSPKDYAPISAVNLFTVIGCD